jgi:hypothetical protein
VLKPRNLVLLLAVGCTSFVLFAFTIIGLVGEALIIVSLAGFSARIAEAAARHRRRS